MTKQELLDTGRATLVIIGGEFDPSHRKGEIAKDGAGYRATPYIRVDGVLQSVAGAGPFDTYQQAEQYIIATAREFTI